MLLRRWREDERDGGDVHRLCISKVLTKSEIVKIVMVQGHPDVQLSEPIMRRSLPFTDISKNILCHLLSSNQWMLLHFRCMDSDAYGDMILMELSNIDSHYALLVLFKQRNFGRTSSVTMIKNKGKKVYSSMFRNASGTC